MQGLISAFSADRFSSYLLARANDPARALALYEWNAALCAAFYLPLQAVEVGLRNACHGELQKTFGADWPFEPHFLGIDLGIHRTVENAKEETKKSKRPVDTPHVVASLHFGFWTYLLSKKLTDSIWIPAIHRAFPHFAAIRCAAIQRSNAAGTFDTIRSFRNRVFHHEPLFHRTSLQSDYDRLIEAASWMSADLPLWIAGQSVACASMVASGPP
jgi:hypothetical protein